MVVENIPLRFAGTRRIARLRELTGRDERAVSDASTANAIRLLDALLDNAPTTSGDELIRAADLVTTDRDRLLAALYERTFGDRIQSILACTRCAQPFDLHFSLRELTGAINERTYFGEWKPLDNGRFEAADGLCFRLPTGHDELAVAGLASNEAESLLLDRCTEGRGWPASQIPFEELLKKIAPLLDFELSAPCAECGHVHTIEFDIQSYLLCAIMGDRSRLLAETHRIATFYAWTLDEIHSLTRSDRRRFVELIENEMPRNRRTLK